MEKKLAQARRLLQQEKAANEEYEQQRKTEKA